MIIKEIPQSGETRHYKLIKTKIIKDVFGKDVEIESGSNKVCLEQLRVEKQEALKRFQDAKARFLAVKSFEVDNVRLPMPEPIAEIKEVELKEEDIVEAKDLEEVAKE